MCQGGYILLVNWSTRQIAAYNPLTRALDILPLPDEISNAFRGNFIRLDFPILSSEEADGSFRVLGLYYGKSEMRAAVFSSNTHHGLKHPHPVGACNGTTVVDKELHWPASIGHTVEWIHVLATQEEGLHAGAGYRNTATFLHRSAGAVEGIRGHLHDWGNQG